MMKFLVGLGAGVAAILGAYLTLNEPKVVDNKNTDPASNGGIYSVVISNSDEEVIMVDDGFSLKDQYGEDISLDLTFRDESGNDTSLKPSRNGNLSRKLIATHEYSIVTILGSELDAGKSATPAHENELFQIQCCKDPSVTGSIVDGTPGFFCTVTNHTSGADTTYGYAIISDISGNPIPTYQGQTNKLTVVNQFDEAGSNLLFRVRVENETGTYDSIWYKCLKYRGEVRQVAMRGNGVCIYKDKDGNSTIGTEVGSSKVLNIKMDARVFIDTDEKVVINVTPVGYDKGMNPFKVQIQYPGTTRWVTIMSINTSLADESKYIVLPKNPDRLTYYGKCKNSTKNPIARGTSYKFRLIDSVNYVYQLGELEVE